MRKILFFTAAQLILLAPSLHAVQLCVPNNNLAMATFLTGAGSFPNHRGSWSRTLENGAPINGVWMCGSSQAPGGWGGISTAANGPSVGSGNVNTNCWCRMTGPVLGAHWVFLSSYTSPGLCVSECRVMCHDNVASEEVIRNVLLAVP